MEGFQLYPSAKTFIVSQIILALTEKLKNISANKLERFVKEELQKHTFVNMLMNQLRDMKPLLYKMVQPTELQITCFLKSSSKLIKDALLMKEGSTFATGQPINSEFNPELEKNSEVEIISTT